VLFKREELFGDMMNFHMAAEMLRPGERDRYRPNDDVAVENSTYTDPGRRGVAGTLVVEKIVPWRGRRGADSPR